MPTTGRQAALPHPLAERVLLIALLVFAFASGCERVWDGDVPWHITAGDWILRHHSLPTTEVWSSRGSELFTPTSWLFQLLAALLHRLGGFALLSVLSGGITALIAFLLYRSCHQGSRGALAGMLIALTLFVVQRRIRVRPEEFSMLFLLGTMVLWDRKRSGRLPLLALLFAVWANTHTLFVLGPLVLACGLIGIAIERRRIDRSGWLPGFATIAACAVTPMPAAFLRVPLLAFSQARGTEEVFARGFTELAPTLESLGSADVLVYLGLTVTCALLMILRRARIPWHHRLWFLLTLPLGLMAVRNIGLASIACAYLILRQLPGWRAGSRFSLPACVLLLLVGAFGYASGAIAALTQRVPGPGLGLQKDHYPFELARRIADAPGSGAILPLDFASAGAFMLTARPKDDPSHKLFIDARSDVHGSDEYVRLFRIRTMFQESSAAVDQVDLPAEIEFIVVDFKDIEILHNLANSARYRIWYLDRNHACFVRADAPGHAANIADYERPFRGDGPIIPGADYRKSWSNLHPVTTHLRLGVVFGALGETRLAIRYLEAAEALSNGARCDRRMALAMAWLDLAESEGAYIPPGGGAIPALRALWLAERSRCDARDPLPGEIQSRAGDHLRADELGSLIGRCSAQERPAEGLGEAAIHNLLEGDARGMERLAALGEDFPLLPVLAAAARGDWIALRTLLPHDRPCPAAAEISALLGRVLG